VDISNLRDTTSLHHLFQGVSDGVEGETEAGVAAAEGEFPLTGAPNLSGLAIDSDWCSQQEETAVVGGVGGQSEWAWKDFGRRHCLFSGHG